MDDDADANDDERRDATGNGRRPGRAIVVDVRRTRRIQAERSHAPAAVAGDCCDDRLLFILIFITVHAMDETIRSYSFIAIVYR